MKKSFILFNFLIIFLLSACASKKAPDTLYRYREKRSELNTKASAGQADSEEYDQLYDSDTDFTSWPQGGVLFTHEGTAICQAYSDSPYYIFDLNTGKNTGIYLEKDMLFENGNCQPFLYGEYGSEFLMASGGIYEHVQDEWILRVPSERTSMLKGGFIAREIGRDPDGIYYLCDKNYKYRYIPEEIDKTEKQVHLKITVLQDRSTLKTALTEYQIANPSVTVDYNFMCVELPDSEQELNTLLQKINAEVSSNQAADLYVLDYLPIEGFWKNGYLMDLHDIVQPYADNGDYFGNVITIYEEEGALYTVPWFFKADFIICKQELVPYVKDIHSFAAFLESHPEEPGLVPYYFRNQPNVFLAMMYDYYGEGLYENGELTLESVKNYLRSLMIIYERQQKNPFATLADGRRDSYSDILFSPSFTDLYLLWEKEEGNVSLFTCTPMACQSMAQVSHNPGYAIVPISGVHPQYLLGIHAASSEKEQAADLLSFLLSYFEKYGKGDRSIEMFGFLPGLPIYKRSVEAHLTQYFSEENDPSEKSPFYTLPVFDTEYPFYYPTSAACEEIIQLLEKFDSPAPYAYAWCNNTFSILQDRVPGYLKGERSLDITAEDVYNGLALMNNEKQ